MQRHPRQFLGQARRVAGELVDRLHRIEFLGLERQQGQGEKLRENNEVGAIVRRDIDEIFDVADEPLEILDGARLQLAGGQADAFDAARHAHFGRFVGIDIGVAPDEMCGVAVGLLVFGQIIFQHAQRFELVLELEADDLIADLARRNLVQIILRALDLALGAQIARHPAGNDDAMQIELFGQFLAFVIEALADAQAAQLGVHRHLIAIEPFARRAVARAKAVGGDFLPIMPGKGHALADPHRRAIAHDLVIVERDEAAIGEIVDLAAHGGGGIIG